LDAFAIYSIKKQGQIVTSGAMGAGADDYIRRRIADDPDLAVWQGDGDPPDPETDVIDPETGKPRRATKEEQARMPAARRRVKKSEAKGEMQTFAGMGRKDVDAWLDRVFAELPNKEADAKAWINENVTNVASAKRAMKKIVAALYDQRRATRQLAHVLLAVIRRLDWDEPDA